MKRLANLIPVVGILIVFGPLVAIPARGSTLILPETQLEETSLQGGTGMPGWPIPEKPIPHHEPGQAARSGGATHTVKRLNETGEMETVELRGLDALLADGTLPDPLGGNYRLVGLDKIMFGVYDFSPSGPNHNFSVQTFDLVTPTIELLPGSDADYGDQRFNAIAAGDLNGDYVDEQISAWVRQRQIPLSGWEIVMNVGEIPGSLGEASSPPAVIAHPDGSLEVVVRGYDQALWYLQYDGATWGNWDNSPGGLLVSNPALVSRTAGALDVFAVGMDNQVYQQHRGEGWGDWNLVNCGGTWNEIERRIPVPEIPAPAVVTLGGDQLDLFRLSPDNTLLRCHSSNGITWGAWEDLGGMLASAPGAVALGDGRMQVYALGMDGALWYRTYNGSWGAWQRLETPDGVAGNAFPVLASPGTGQVNVYLAGTENRVWSNQHNGSAWGSWSSTNVTGGELGAGISAAINLNGTYLFAQMSDGRLQYSLNASGWVSLEGLGVTQESVTQAITKQPPTDPTVIENTMFHITTGYFSGDGRQQIVLAYDGADDNLRLEIYDIRDGFRLVKIAEIATSVAPIPGQLPRVAAGDVTGDGVDEIGLLHNTDGYNCHLRVFQLTKSTSGNTPYVLNQLVDKPIAFLWGDYYYFAGTLRIAAGDVVAEGIPNDEFVLISDWYHEGDMLGVILQVYDHDPGGWDWTKHIAGVIDAGYQTVSDIKYTGFDVAVGNVDGVGADEIIFTWPTSMYHWPDVQRDLVVYRLEKTNFNFIEKGRYSGIGSSRTTFLDTLAAGDLDLDLKDEIVMSSTSGESFYPNEYLDVYEFETTSVDKLARYTLDFYMTPRAFNLALGDFTGEGIRVGPPTYRVQEQMTTPVALINLPPMHRDIIEIEGENTEITIGEGLYAEHSAGNLQEEWSSVESKRDWSLSTGIETSIGYLGSTVELSMNNTYEEDFSNTEGTINSIQYRNTTTADQHDQLLVNQTSYAVWEYPVIGLQGEGPDLPKTIAVTWPIVETTNTPATKKGQLCDENFYTPRHQIYNVWSYDPVGTVRFGDYEAGRELHHSSSTGGSNIELVLTGTSEEERTSSFNNQISAGLSYSYENELNIPLVGKAWDFSFRAYAEGSYGFGKISNFGTRFTEESQVVIDIPSLPASAYEIWAYLYWASGGYLVVDYLTGPEREGAWLLYSKPDPAFTLPWYGFPDTSGIFPPPQYPDAPPCGPEKQLFTHDIELNPVYVQNGETVTMTATLRNFSNVNPSVNVNVYFYLGQPATGNEIGSCQIPSGNLDRDDGPKQCSDTWIVSGGSGEEKIYAVIDPTNVIDEMHDEEEVINNNIGYGLLNVARADYLDPGLSRTQVFQPILHEEAPGLGFGLYLPTANITETVRYELMPISIEGQSSVGSPIQVLAFRGGQQLPEDQHHFGEIPAGIMAFYRDGDLLPGMDKADLKFYRQVDDANWEEATCPGYQVVRFPQDNRLAIPICQAGTFILSTDATLAQLKLLYLPIIVNRP